MSSKLLLLFITITFTSQNCDKGCIKCGSNDQCLFCDTTQNFYISGFKCEVKEETNCELLSSEGECLICFKEFYLDSLSRKCVEIPENKKIINCAYYSSDIECIHCKEGFYISEDLCQPIPNAIENCLNYYNEDSTLCERCKNEYVLAEDSKSCFDVSN